LKQHVAEIKSESEVTILTDKTELIATLENEYVSKILGYAYQKANTREDAEDLAQEIACQVLKAIRSGKEIDNFNALVWSISNHTFFNWLRSKKRSSTNYLTELFASDENIEEEYTRREQKALLYRELAILSSEYREAIVLHYFDGKSCGEIGNILGKSSGTVKWWLYDARKFMKEGMNTMREYGERSYKPGALRLSCQCQPGANEEPMSCAKRKSAQNILLAAYKAPVSVEELCVELGISAPYIEDEIGYLVDNQLMKEVSAGKYQTDFVILPGQNVGMADKIYETCFPAYYHELLAFLESNKEILSGEKFNTAGFAWDRLLWVYIHMITDICLCKFKREECKIVMYDDIPNRPNGGKWIALGFENSFFFEIEPEWKKYHPFDGPVHKGGNDFAQGFFHYWSGLDSSIFFDIPDGVFALCREIIKGNISAEDLNDEQKYLFSVALEKKLFIKTDNGFRQNYCFIDGTQRHAIEKLAYAFYETAKKYCKTAYDLVLKEYLPGVPLHLQWQMGNFLSNHLNNFVTCSLYEGVRNGILSQPDEFNKEWLSLFASE
jgi:RNA polymerase sigma factor (sigma-70 family)